MRVPRETIERILLNPSMPQKHVDSLQQALHRDDVEQHFANGGEVECISKGRNKGLWAFVANPRWDWDCFDYDYRIKQKSMSERRDELLIRLDGRLEIGEYDSDVVEALDFLKELEL